jgi:hypothetical protein
MQLRWKLDHVHSHSNKYGFSKRSKGGVNRGPIHSVSFSKNNYDCLVVDSFRGILIVDCQAGGIKRTITSPDEDVNYLCADWNCRNVEQYGDLVVGLDSGAIAFVNQKNDMEIVVPDIVKNNTEDVNWSCTHVQCFAHHVAVGLCRVFPEDGEEESGDDDDYGDEDDDEVTHEANLLIYDANSEEWTELGDVVAFFGVPKYARHAFYTAYLQKQELLLVGCNVTGEIGIVAKINGGWQVCELQEGNAATAPITDDDEFTVPTGITCVVDSKGNVNVIMSATDGSVSAFELNHVEHDTYGIADLVGEWKIENDHVEMKVLIKEPQLMDKSVGGTMNNVEPEGYQKASTPSTPAFGSGPSNGISFRSGTAAPLPFESNTDIPAFGSGLTPLVASTTPTSTPFGITPTIGSSPSPLGSSTKCASSLSAPYGSPSFGISSATAGSFSLAPTVATTEPTPTLSENERHVPVFGSGSKAPVFGLGLAPTFGSETSNHLGTLAKGSVGCGSLAAQAEYKKEFGSASPFGTFHNPSKPSIDASMVKPLFQQSNISTINLGPKPNITFTAPLPKEIETELLLSLFLSSAEAKYAVKLFDTLGQDKEGKIPIDRLQILLQEFSEGFHGYELDKLSAILDPDSSGFISRSSFIDWYCKQLGDDSNDIGLLDTKEREGRKNETTKAVDASESIATAGVYRITDFGKLLKAARVKLIEAVGTPYCEEEYRREIKKISDVSGNISQEECRSWGKKSLAADAFESIATAGVVKYTDFGELIEAAGVKLIIEAVGTTYCEEEYRRAMKKISDDSGNISQEAFVSWYTDWLSDREKEYSDMSDREKECNDTTGDEFQPAATSAYLNIDTATGIATSIPIYRNRVGAGLRPVATSAYRNSYPNRVILRGKRPVATSVNSTTATATATDTAASIPGWSIYDKDSWKCEACMVRNNGDLSKCAGCEIVRPGHENNAQTGGESKSSAQIGGEGSIGFTFGAAGAREDSSSSSKRTGFSFGGAPPTTGLSASPASDGFSFGYNTASPVKKAAPTPFGASSTKPVASSGSAFPPISTKAPTLFGESTKKPVTSSGSAFPLLSMSTKAPTPFSGSTIKPIAIRGSAFPPMSTKAPKPFGGGASCGFTFSAAGDDRSTLSTMSSSKTKKLQLAAEALAEAARLVAAASLEVDPVTQNREALMCYFETSWMP